MRFLLLGLLALVPLLASGFTVPAGSDSSNGEVAITKSSSTSLSVALTPDADVIAPALLLIAGAVATIATSEKTEEIVPLPPSDEPTPAEEPEPEPEPAPEPVTTVVPEPVEETPPTFAAEGSDTTATSAGDSIAELRRDVAKTYDETSTVPQTQLLQRSSPSPTPLAEEEEDKATWSVEPVEKKKGVLRKTFRVVKKIIAPWRKWDNIS